MSKGFIFILHIILWVGIPITLVCYFINILNGIIPRYHDIVR